MRLPVWQVVLIILAAVSGAAQPFLARGVAQAAQSTAHTAVKLVGKERPAPPHSLAYPDPSLTPGEARSSDATELCAKGFTTKKYRHTSAATKAEVYREYGVIKGKGDCARGCEVDHLIPLELLGADELDNLWPEPYEPKPGAHEKDAIETRLRVLVCHGQIPLGDAQKEIAVDWIAAYEKYIGPIPTQ